MEPPVVETCECGAGGLGVLGELQRVYRERLATIENSTAADKLQHQVSLLRSWVNDLLDQNAVLARAVEELEVDAVELLREQRRSQERSDKSDKLDRSGKLSEQKMRKESAAKDRSPWPKDAEVMAGKSYLGMERDSDSEPVKDYSAQYKEDMEMYQERISKIELNAKSNGEDARGLRQLNARLAEEASTLRRACAALHHQCRAAAQRTAFKDEIIREMRRQLRHAKAKLKSTSSGLCGELRSWGRESGDPPPSPPSLPPEPDSGPPSHEPSDDNLSFKSQ